MAKAQTSQGVKEKAAQEKKQLPLEYEARIHSLYPEGSVRAAASINLNGCFAIRGVKVMEGPKGLFVSMPSYKSGDEYKDICFPTTAEMRKELHSAVLGEYQRTMEQSYSRAEKAMEKRESVLDTLSQKAAEVRPPAPGKAKAADKGER